MGPRLGGTPVGAAGDTGSAARRDFSGHIVRFRAWSVCGVNAILRQENEIRGGLSAGLFLSFTLRSKIQRAGRQTAAGKPRSGVDVRVAAPSDVPPRKWGTALLLRVTDPRRKENQWRVRELESSLISFIFREMFTAFPAFEVGYWGHQIIGGPLQGRAGVRENGKAGWQWKRDGNTEK